jgi:hypothetical protein
MIDNTTTLPRQNTATQQQNENQFTIVEPQTSEDRNTETIGLTYERYMDIEEVCTELHKTPAQIKRMIYTGVIVKKVAKTNNEKIQIRRSSVEKFIQMTGGKDLSKFTKKMSDLEKKVYDEKILGLEKNTATQQQTIDMQSRELGIKNKQIEDQSKSIERLQILNHQTQGLLMKEKEQTTLLINTLSPANRKKFFFW